MRRVLLLLLLLALSACGPLPDRVLVTWDRIVASGVLSPPGTVDTLTVTQEGNLTRVRGGATSRGTWSEDGSQVTLSFPHDVTSWATVRKQCPDGRQGCIVLTNPTATDWYRAEGY